MLEGLGISLGYLLVFILSFGILFMVLRAWVYQPMLRMLENRRVTIARGLEDARVAAEARANAEAEANRIISEAQSKAAEIVRDATTRAGSVEKEIRAQAEGEMARARESAAAEMEGERNRMLSEVRGQIVSLAMAAARKLLKENLDDQRQRTILQEFFSGIRGGRVQFANEADMAGAESAEVTSALPLSEEEKATVRRELSSRLGIDLMVDFKVDPSILGGLVIRAGDQVVDGSYAGQLDDLRQNLR